MLATKQPLESNTPVGVRCTVFSKAAHLQLEGVSLKSVTFPKLCWQQQQQQQTAWVARLL